MAKQQSQRIGENFHFHSSLPSPEMSHYKTLYKYKLKHQKFGEALPLLESYPQEPSTKKISTETSTNRHEQSANEAETDGIVKQGEEVNADKA